MSSKHTRLVAAVSDAMAAQNMSQNTIGRVSGVAQSMISAALLGKYDMKEEKWRLICEALAIDYDEIVADVPVETASSVSPQADCHLPQVGEGKDTAAPVKNCGGGTEVPLSEEPQNSKTDRDNLFLLAMYAEGRLAKDIEAGMKVDPMKLWGILDALKKIKDNALKPE